MQVGWTVIKEFATSRSLSIQYVTLPAGYWLYASDDALQLECTLHINRQDEIDEFEASYKAAGNKNIPKQQHQPFASKILPNGKKLYKREHGIQAAVVQGENTVLFTIPYPWVKMVGVEILYAEKLDTVNLMVLDSTTGTYTTIPNYQLNQFAFNVNVSEGEYEEECAYDADLYAGMQIKIVYTSQSSKSVGFNFNLNEVK
jgi:hypothetical protein